MKKYLIQIWNRERPLKDIWHYLVGNYRYQLYYSKLKFLIRSHIRQQIAYRIKVMRPECYQNGECVMCGCSTTALQMCNKPCEGDCYPPMKTRKQWNEYVFGPNYKI